MEPELGVGRRRIGQKAGTLEQGRDSGRSRAGKTQGMVAACEPFARGEDDLDEGQVDFCDMCEIERDVVVILDGHKNILSERSNGTDGNRGGNLNLLHLPPGGGASGNGRN